jgi:starch synthase (maltosyl-transferring)
MPQRTRTRAPSSAPQSPDARAHPIDGHRRVVIERVRPEIYSGRFPIKRIPGESVRVTAWIHADGHDELAAVVRYRPVPERGGRRKWMEAPMRPIGNDEWEGGFDIDRRCAFEYTVHAWVDRFASWRHELAAKVEASQDVASELLEGAAMVRTIAARARASRAASDARWLDGRADVIGGAADMIERARAALDQRVASIARRFPDRSHAAAYDRVLAVSVDRERARFGAWYEMFPRSWGPDPARSATFSEAEAHLPRVAAMGFDVVYLPPIHPIGTSFRKGRGNTLRAEQSDPGSPWAIGSAEGGHKAIDPGLGTLDDFDHFVGEARRLGLEIALDLAFQCSPDHPYVREHPEWFRHRPDGSIKYAENPPKKYQDIFPFDFECEAWRSLWQELKSVVEFWTTHGVSIFRVDNPHTKPYAFWEWLIRGIRADHPDVIFLAEAFTRPKVMYYLAALGFAQSYSYFTWRNTKDELTGYFTELTSTDVAEFFRPNLFANTPDILHAYLQRGGPPAFKIRLLLAATLGATYGIYSGFELCENRAVEGTEEYLDSEKYQYRAWDWNGPGHIRDLVTAVNRVRRENPALQSNRGLTFCQTDNPHLIAFCKVSADRSNAILVVVNLDYERMQHGWVQVPADRLGLSRGEAYEVVDQLDEARYSWQGDWNYVRLDPSVNVAHILELPAPMRDVVTTAGRALGQFLPNQRWFAGKARTIASAGLVDWAPMGPRPRDPLLAIASVEYADGGRDLYQTPLAILRDMEAPAPLSGAGTIARLDGSPVVDALEDDAACRTILDAMLEGRSLKMHRGRARATAYRREVNPGGLDIRRSTSEQSNSCVMFGGRFVLKILRRLEPGPNPELEVLQYLSTRGVTFVPPLTASLVYEAGGEEPLSLALVQGFVRNSGSGWDRAVDDVRRFTRRDAPDTEPSIAFLDPAATLGRRTAELHLALAGNDADPAFRPERATSEHAAALVAQLHGDLERALTPLAERLEAIPRPARDRARAVLDARDDIHGLIATFAAAPPGSLRTRVHGDYHLGQVLVVGQDFVVIDFEGEPARPLEERRRKHPPLKDVAGMLRSFSYAAYATMLEEARSQPDQVHRLEAAAQVWLGSVSAAFVTAYRQTTQGTSLVPDDDRGFAQWLDAFLLEKALYELQYEMGSRPSWVGIPLMGILRIVHGADARTALQ